MSTKALKITFSGINTLTPAETDASTNTAHVMMGAVRTAGDDGIPVHKAFVYVPEKFLSAPPQGADTVIDHEHGPTRIYHVDHARVRLSSEPSSPPQYFVDTKDIGERPGPIDVADADDMRWMADLRDIVPGMRGFAAGCDPNGASVSDLVAMVVTLNSGLFKANFPCATVQPQVFFADGLRLDIDRRVYAQEFTVTIEYPQDAGPIALLLEPLRDGAVPTGVPGNRLDLQWDHDVIELRMGNDTEAEIRALIDFARCDIPFIPRPRGNDFPLHYKFIDLDRSLPRPIPDNGTLHTEHNGCLGVRNGG